MARIGYAKAHPAYSLEQQVAVLKEAGCDVIYQDKSANDYSAIHKAIEAYQEGEDVFLTLLHRTNDLIQPQFLAMLELKKYTKSRGRPKKDMISTSKVAINLWQQGLSAREICEALEISSSTFSRIKKQCTLAENG